MPKIARSAPVELTVLRAVGRDFVGGIRWSLPVVDHVQDALRNDLDSEIGQ